MNSYHDCKAFISYQNKKVYALHKLYHSSTPRGTKFLGLWLRETLIAISNIVISISNMSKVACIRLTHILSLTPILLMTKIYIVILHLEISGSIRCFKFSFSHDIFIYLVYILFWIKEKEIELCYQLCNALSRRVLSCMIMKKVFRVWRNEKFRRKVQKIL